jgi:hypothetical protein
LAGGLLLLQLANESAAVQPAEVGERVQVGDVGVTVFGAEQTTLENAELFSVDVEVGGVDDDIASFSLATGDMRLEPESTPDEGRCTEITVAARRCRVEFDVSASGGSNRVLVLRRGDQQRNWVLEAP